MSLRAARHRDRVRAIAVPVVALALLFLSPPRAPGAQPVSGSDSHQTGTGGTDTAPPPPGPPPGPLTEVSDPDPGNGTPPRGNSTDPVIACDDPGVVAFRSDADNLTADDGNGRTDVFVNDHGVISRVSDDPPGAKLEDVTAGPALSCDGDTVVHGGAVREPPTAETPEDRVMVTDPTTGNTVVECPPPTGARVGGVGVDPQGDTVVWEQGGDIWVDQAGNPESCGREPGGPGQGGPGQGGDGPAPVSTDPTGTPTGGSSDPGICEGGRRIVFVSDSPRLVAGDTNGTSDVFVASGKLTPDTGDDSMQRISAAAGGDDADGPSYDPAISADCRKVVFTSCATNLVPGDTNGTCDVFVNDVDTGTTTPVTEGWGPSGDGAISGDGSHVGFTSTSDDIVPGDTNGANPANATPTSFQAVDRAGHLTYATSIVAVDGPRVRVAFPDGLDLGRATAGSVDPGTLIDGQILPVGNPDGRSNTNPGSTRPLTTRDENGAVRPTTDDITEGPDLTGAKVVTDDGGTPGDPADDVAVVQYCFDEPAATITSPQQPGGTDNVETDRFAVEGYNSSARVQSVFATVERDDKGAPTGCLRATFPSDADVARFTLAAVPAGAVTDRDGQPNVQGSKALDGTTVAPRPGDVTGPNLRSTAVDYVANTVTFTFDEIAGTSPAAAGTDPATRFLFLDNRGTPHPGTTISAVDPKAQTVTVAFDLGAHNLVNARRYVALADAVRNGAGEPNVEQATDGDVDGPELVRVTRVDSAGPNGPPRFDFTFNRPVGRPDLARFFLAAEDGTRFGVASVDQPGPTVVRVEVPAVAPFVETVVLGGAEDRAVFERIVADGAAATGHPNTLGVKPVATRPTPPGSVSDGPDLQSVEPVPGTQEVDFVFDEPVRDPQLVLEPPEPGLPGDVFVRDLDSGRVTRPSVDGNGRQAPGSSGSPSLSRDGRHVAFDSSAPLVPSGGGTRQAAYLRDLLAVELSPGTVDFGAAPAGAKPGPPRAIVVTNRGEGRLAIRAVALAGTHPGDFRIVANRCLQPLAPQQRCTVTVAFVPVADGDRLAELTFADNAPGSPHRATLKGVRLPPVPVLAATPELGSPGTATMVSGAAFPPNTTLELSWSPDPTVIGPAPLPTLVVVTTDAAGRLPPTPLLVLPGDILGPRALRAAGARLAVPVTTPFLVVPGTVQPAVTPNRAAASPGGSLPGFLFGPVQLMARR